MEQAYRRLREKLTNHPLVERVDCNYYFFVVTWKSGIKERLVINNFDNDNKVKFKYYIKSPIRPHFMPKAMWWEHLSNGYEPKPHYLENVEFEDDTEKYSNLINWKWADYEKCGFYEKLLLIHEILQYIIEHEWKEQKFPENTLRHSLQMVYDESPKGFHFTRRRGLRIRSYRKLAERPASKLLEHFMPYGFYGRDDPYHFMSTKSIKQRRRIYLAIRNIIRKNRNLKSKGKKQFFDFNYRNILKHMRNQDHSVKISPYKMRQVGLLRSLIDQLDMQGKTFYDVDPMMGEMHIAAHTKECSYYYRESAPFDQGAKLLSQFIGSHCEIDNNNRRYDFGIYDGHLSPNYPKACYAFDVMKEKVDLAIIYVANEYMEQWREKYPGSHDSLEMKCSRDPNRCGRWLLYYT